MDLAYYSDSERTDKKQHEVAMFLEKKLFSMNTEQIKESLAITPIYPRVLSSDKHDWYSYQGLLYELAGIKIGDSLFSYVPRNIKGERKELFWEEFYPFNESDELLNVLRGRGLGTLIHCASLIYLVNHLKLTPDYFVSHSQDLRLVSNSRMLHLKKMKLADGENPLELFPIMNYLNRSLRYAKKTFGFKFENPLDKYFAQDGDLILQSSFL